MLVQTQRSDCGEPVLSGQNQSEYRRYDARCKPAIGYRPPGHDRVAITGTHVMQCRPGGQYDE